MARTRLTTEEEFIVRRSGGEWTDVLHTAYEEVVDSDGDRMSQPKTIPIRFSDLSPAAQTAVVDAMTAIREYRKDS